MRQEMFPAQALAQLAHELGNPLTTLRLNVHLMRLAADAGRPAPVRALNILEANIDRLARLVTDLQDMGTLYSGRLRIERRRVSLTDVLDEATEAVEAKAASSGVRISMDPRAVDVEVDSGRIVQVLVNLLNNAIKFTPAGGRVVVRSRVADEMARVEVHDSGRGLEPAEASCLFHAFSQVHRPEEAREKGTGLGLVIARGIIGVHGGQIWCESQGRGHGSMFAFTLPLAGHSAPIRPTLTVTGRTLPARTRSDARATRWRPGRRRGACPRAKDRHPKGGACAMAARCRPRPSASTRRPSLGRGREQGA